MRRIDWDSLNVKGYGFQISLLESVVRTGGIVREIPIIFVDRVKGKSKIRLADMSEFLKVLALIFLSRKPASSIRKRVVAAHG